jgi:hypothetical protein
MVKRTFDPGFLAYQRDLNCVGRGQGAGSGSACRVNAAIVQRLHFAWRRLGSLGHGAPWKSVELRNREAS